MDQWRNPAQIRLPAGREGIVLRRASIWGHLRGPAGAGEAADPRKRRNGVPHCEAVSIDENLVAQTVKVVEHGLERLLARRVVLDVRVVSSDKLGAVACSDVFACTGVYPGNDRHCLRHRHAENLEDAHCDRSYIVEVYLGILFT